MGRMEITTQMERLRTYSEAEKVTVAEALAPSVTVRDVLRLLGHCREPHL